MTTGMVGADLANLVNEAALLAARRNLDRVNMRCFIDALDRIQLGAERPLVLSEEDLRVVAIHEAGHALVGLLTPHSDPVTKVTIVPRGQALGVTQYTPMDDRYNYSKEYLFGRIMTALGGRGAEEVVDRQHHDRRRERPAADHADRAQHGRTLGHEQPVGSDLL